MAVVKTALLRHLDMDLSVVLGVMYDQVLRPEEDANEMEQQTREQLRSLVLSFLAKDALRFIIRKFSDPSGAEAEQILVQQLLEVGFCFCSHSPVAR